MNQKYPESRKIESENENTAGTICTPLRTKKKPRGYLFASLGPTRGLSEKWNCLIDVEEEKDDNAPIDIDDDDK